MVADALRLAWLRRRARGRLRAGPGSQSTNKLLHFLISAVAKVLRLFVGSVRLHYEFAVLPTLQRPLGTGAGRDTRSTPLRKKLVRLFDHAGGRQNLDLAHGSAFEFKRDHVPRSLVVFRLL